MIIQHQSYQLCIKGMVVVHLIMHFLPTHLSKKSMNVMNVAYSSAVYYFLLVRTSL